MATELTLDDFLNDKGSRGGRTSYLGKWKDKGYANVVLHVASPITKVWRHPFQRVVERKDKDNPQIVTFEIWGDKFVCFEDDETLEKMHFRDRETKLREVAPCACATCKMVEFVYQRIVNHGLDWKTPIFRFAAPGKEAITLRAGGITGLFNRRDLSDARKAELREAGIIVRDAWKQVMLPKLEYVFRVVDVDDPKEVQIAVEAQGLGDAVKKVIVKSIESLGPERGNPMRNPYVIKWTFNKNSSNFGEMYDANPLFTMPITQRVNELIRGPLPSITGITRRIKVASMRSMLEAAAVVKLPWDQFFEGMQDEEEREAEQHSQQSDADDSFPFGANAPSQTTQQAVPSVGASASAQMIPCDNPTAGGAICGNPMRADETTCTKCGAVYQIEATPAPAAGWDLSGKGAAADDGPGTGFAPRTDKEQLW